MGVTGMNQSEKKILQYGLNVVFQYIRIGVRSFSAFIMGEKIITGLNCCIEDLGWKKFIIIQLFYTLE